MAISVRRIEEEFFFLTGVQRFADAGCILAGLWIAHSFGTPMAWEHYVLMGMAAVAAFSLVGELTRAYRSWRGVPGEKELVCVLGTWCLTVAALLLVGFLTRYTLLVPRSLMLVWTAATPALAVLLRVSLRWTFRSLRAHGLNHQRFAIVGVNPLGIQLARNIEAAPELGLHLAGFYDDRPSERVADLPPRVGTKLGDLEQLYAAARRGDIQRIYITFPMRAEKRIQEALERLADTTASVYIVPDFFVFELLHSRWSSVNGLPVVSVFENPLYGIDGVVKRATDVALSAALLTVLAIPMLIIAILVKRSGPGPVFFRQRRYGIDGEEFLVWKFRTMRVCENGAVVTQATKEDPRVTKIGAFLRKTSLDELPQLFNVFDGTMSLVGPRPHASAHNEEYRQLIQGYMLRHKVKPGITGLAQVNGYRGETDTLEKMEGRVRFDHQYIREWSWWLDLRILLRTFFVVLKRENAY